MRIAPLFVAINLYCVINTAVLADRDPVPDDYPSHNQATGCTTDLQQKLQAYNVTRVQVGDVLHNMADNYKLEAKVREGLQDFAENLTQMGKELPQPDPDSDEFRNFDFKFGLALTAVTVYLNTRDESLTRQFQSDQHNPDSVLGVYLTELDLTREAYMTGLDASSSRKTSACS